MKFVNTVTRMTVDYHELKFHVGINTIVIGMSNKFSYY
jgi:hypothetical protein